MLYKVKKLSILKVFAVTFYGICILLYTVFSGAISISEDTIRISCQRALEGLHTRFLNLKTGEKPPTVPNEFRQLEIFDGMSKLIRANVHVYSQTLRDEVFLALIGPELEMWTKLYQHSGMILVDSHNGNISMSLINGSIQPFPCDLDDVGMGPFILDISHYIASVKSIIMDQGYDKIKTNTLVEAYVAGLTNTNEYKMPDSWKSASKMSAKDFWKMVDKYIKKRVDTKSGQFRTHEKYIQFENQHEAQLKLKQQLLKTAGAWFPNYEVNDVVIGRKESGGSLGGKRYVFSLKDPDGKLWIYELKENLPPASRLVHVQLDHKNRILEFQNLLWPGGPDPMYKMVNLNGQSFQLRPKFPEVVPDPFDMNDIDYRELSIYHAWLLGRWHSLSPESSMYIKAIGEFGIDSLASMISNLNKYFFEKTRQEIEGQN